MASWAAPRCLGQYSEVKRENDNLLTFINPSQGLLRKRGNLKATTLRSRSDEYKTELVKNFTKDCLKNFEVSLSRHKKTLLDIFPFQGPAPSLAPVVDRVMNIKEVVTAHTLMEQNKNTGKIVLTMSK